MEKTRKRKLNKQDLLLIYLGISLILLLIYALTSEIGVLILIGIIPVIYFIHIRLIYIKLVNKLEDQRYFDVFLHHSKIEVSQELLSIEEITTLTDPYFLHWEKSWNKKHNIIPFFYNVKLTNSVPGTKPFDRFILILNGKFDPKTSFFPRTMLFDGFEVKVSVSKPHEFTILDWDRGIPIILSISLNKFEGLLTKEDVEKIKEEAYNDLKKQKYPAILKLFENYFFITLLELREFEILLDKEKELEVKSFDKFILRTTKKIEREEIANQISTFQFVEMLADSHLFKEFDWLTELNINVPIFNQIDLGEKTNGIKIIK